MALTRRKLLGSAIAASAVDSTCEGAASEIAIDRFDHVVLTVRSIAATCDFYQKVLRMDVVDFAGGRKALRFGQSKINLHEPAREIEPKAARPAPGSADLCFITRMPLADIVKHLNTSGVQNLIGPAERTGALGPIHPYTSRSRPEPHRSLALCVSESPQTSLEGFSLKIREH